MDVDYELLLKNALPQAIEILLEFGLDLLDEHVVIVD